MRYFIFQLLLVIIVSVKLCVTAYQKRIIGGEEAPPDKYRWAVSIKGNVDQLKVSGACGASILKTGDSTRWLLTAAHCFYPTDGRVFYDLTNPSLWHARVGLTKVDFEYQKHGLVFKIKEKMKSFFNKAYRKLFGKDKFKVVINDLHIKKIFLHPGFKPPKSDPSNWKMDDDIALMKLKDPLPVEQLSGVSTIDLPAMSLNTSWPIIGSECIVVGWGCTAPGQPANPIAKLASLKIWENTECQRLYKINLICDFCAGYLERQYGMCKGDSGSGLICDYRGTPAIAGVVSRTSLDNPGNYPAVFTRVSPFVEWIYKVVENN